MGIIGLPWVSVRKLTVGTCSTVYTWKCYGFYIVEVCLLNWHNMALLYAIIPGYCLHRSIVLNVINFKYRYSLTDTV